MWLLVTLETSGAPPNTSTVAHVAIRDWFRLFGTCRFSGNTSHFSNQMLTNNEGLICRAYVHKAQDDAAQRAQDLAYLYGVLIPFSFFFVNSHIITFNTEDPVFKVDGINGEERNLFCQTQFHFLERDKQVQHI